MTPAATVSPAAAPMGALSRAEAWLDARGKGAWIAAMILGFIAFWPVGLALVLYMSLTGKWALRRDGSVRMGRWQGCAGRGGVSMRRSTGNAAFDAYRDDTIRKLEEESQAFEEFLQRLREAKDKAEFDQFMKDREDRAPEPKGTEA
ncbi:DUF2852 domain-containing protein [Jannaschia sp. Os4]|uniref:DUF2852 domain-containing protein n=1 Tax=Jannaschia sp. Os4 TaxID=2807617 RepID=UPI00193A7043|nr:DUF2852 domain-containing protein [Jannaschia sp. Os4]MBM2577006.1 DUF2852 domain-containing protein [Jannaschia sp. Os4]